MEHIDNQDIDRYLRQEMTPGETSGFEAKIAADPALRKAVEETRQLAEGIRFAAGRETRRRAEAARDHSRRAERLRKMWRKIWSVAVFLGLAGLLWFGYLHWFSPEKPTTEPTPRPVAASENKAPNPSEKDSLGMTKTGETRPDTVRLLDAEGRETDEKIAFDIVEDSDAAQPKYRFLDDRLRFYVPPGQAFSRPVLFRRGIEIYLKMPDGSERPLPKREQAAPI